MTRGILALLTVASVSAGPLDAGLAIARSSGPSTATVDIMLNRSANWVDAGMSGGIPSNNTLYTNISAGASAAIIQAALDACPSNQYVLLAAGNYNLEDNLHLRNDGVELRGTTNINGWAISKLYGSNANYGVIDISSANYPLPPSAGNIINISNITAGSSSLVCTGTPSAFNVGDVCSLDEIDWWTINAGGGSQARVADRNHFAMLRITNITGNTVSFQPPLLSDFTHTPQLWKWPTGPKRSGVRDLYIHDLNDTFYSVNHNVSIGPADECYVKNVVCTNISEAGVKVGFCMNFEIRDCFFSDHISDAAATYSIWTLYTGGGRIENNIGYNTPCFYGASGQVGGYFGFNFCTNTPYSDAWWLPEVVMTHGMHNELIIIENNHITKVALDNIHGTSDKISVVRNRIPCYDGSEQTDALYNLVQAYNTNAAFFGNVLGTAVIHTGYTNGSTNMFNLNVTNLPSLKANYNTVTAGVPTEEALSANQSLSNSYVYLNSARPEHHVGAWPPFPYDNPTIANSRTNIAAGYRFDVGHWP